MKNEAREEKQYVLVMKEEMSRDVPSLIRFLNILKHGN